jgi:hypothetical protein
VSGLSFDRGALMNTLRIVKYATEYTPAVIEVPGEAIEYMLGIFEDAQLQRSIEKLMPDTGLDELVEMFQNLWNEVEKDAREGEI